jgi:glycosyltransferase involved in cell wall biosynthesis
MNDVERPLVTFALITYNQEAFIRDAIEAALVQDYHPLQIVLSDDGSSDATYQIMQEMAAHYEGPHQIIVRQTSRNLGTLHHVADVASISSGKLMVVAAGDDVSKPERCAQLVKEWQATLAWGLCSRFDRTDASGKILERAVKSPVLSGHRIEQYFNADQGPVEIVHGCTSAYDIRAFDYLKLSDDDYILAEDGAMSFLLNLLGKKVAHLNTSLVLYRENINSLTNGGSGKRSSYSDIVNDELKIEKFARAQANRCSLFLRLNDTLGDSRARRVNVAEIQADLQQQQLRAGWSQMPLSARWRGVKSSEGGKWSLPRLFGLKPFFIIKWLLRQFFGRRLG